MSNSDFECPYCDENFPDGWDYFTGSESDSVDVDCDGCGKTFTAYREATVEYYTYQKKTQ